MWKYLALLLFPLTVLSQITVTPTSSGGGTPGGSSGQVQYNNSGAFGGLSNIAASDTLSIKGADIASATTTDLSTATGSFVNVTGTTTITGLGTAAVGTRRLIKFTGTGTITHVPVSLILPSGANITRANGDVALFESLGGGNWRCLLYQRADGTALKGGIVDGQQIFDGDHVLAADFGARTLLLDDGTTVTVDLASHFLNDALGVNSIDWNNRLLLASDGSTLLDYSSPSGLQLGSILIKSPAAINFQDDAGHAQGYFSGNNGFYFGSTTLPDLHFILQLLKTVPAGLEGEITNDTGLLSIYPYTTTTGSGAIVRATEPTLSALAISGQLTSYNGITTAGTGLPLIVKATRVTAQNAANSSIVSYTTPASDGSYEVSMNALVTAATATSFSLNCDYKDESNTSRTMILPVTGLAGTYLAGGLITSTGPAESGVIHIRTKASSVIKLYTSSGTFTSVTYNAEGVIRQLQ